MFRAFSTSCVLNFKNALREIYINSTYTCGSFILSASFTSSPKCEKKGQTCSITSRCSRNEPALLSGRPSREGSPEPKGASAIEQPPAFLSHSVPSSSQQNRFSRELWIKKCSLIKHFCYTFCQLLNSSCLLIYLLAVPSTDKFAFTHRKVRTELK